MSEKLMQEMTLPELVAHSAKLYDEYYALKEQIAQVNRWRQHRAAEVDAQKALDEAQRKLAGLEEIKPPHQIIYPDPIESDEAVGEVNKDGDTVNQWLMKLLGKSKNVKVVKLDGPGKS